MYPRLPSALLRVFLLASLSLPTVAHAADPDPMSTPLMRAALARRAQVAGAGTHLIPATHAGADPFHVLSTATGSLQGTITRAAAPLEAFRAPSPFGSAAAGKLPTGEGIPGDNFGAALTTLGDMFGDGLSDVAVGAPFEVGPGGTVGGVAVFYESPGALPPPTFFYGEQQFAGFGFSVAGVGDVNGDGYPDMLVGAPFYNANGNADAGRAYLYLGSAVGLQTHPAWILTGTAGATEVGWSVAWAGDVNNDGYDDWLIGSPGAGTAYLFKGGPGPLSNTPAWTFTAPSTQAGQCVATAGDVNGDGYTDILVGSPGFSGSFANEGKVSLFFGHAVKPSIAADDSFLGGQAGAFLGQSVATAGDLDGDGYSDFVMGASGFDGVQPNCGEAIVAYGGPIPALYRTPDVLQLNIANAAFGISVATAGDVNGDGYADLIVGATGISNGTNQGDAFVWVGSQTGIINEIYDVIQSPTAGEITGGAVGTMGDTHGLGFSDYWAGSPGGASGEAFARAGRAYFPGNTEIVAAQGTVSNGALGMSATAADVNGDGYDDLILGSSQGGVGDPDDGFVAAYFGGPRPFQPAAPLFAGAAPDWTFEGDTGDFVGASLANAGDVNGDGYQDFITGAFLHSNPETWEGEAELFYGSPAGPLGGAPWVVEGNQVTALCGYSVTGGGDLNGDGFDDVVVGTPQGTLNKSLQGLGKVYYGSKFGLAHDPAVTYKGLHDSDFLATAVSIVGDINGDGFDDLVVGAMGDSVTLHGQGVAYVYYGSLAGVHATPDDSLVGGQADANFGWSIYRLGDVNGDGYSDVAVSSPHFTDTLANQGLVSVYLGSATGLQKPAAWTLEGDFADVALGMTGISGGDLDGDGYADLVLGDPSSDNPVVDGGLVEVFRGGPSGLDTIESLFETGGIPNFQFGAATVGHADFDGDGFPDLVVTGPGATFATSSSGAAFVRFGNSIWFNQRNQDRPLAAWRADDSAPVAPGQQSDATNAFRLRGRGRMPAGRARLRLESEVKPVSTPFAFTGHALSSWQAPAPIVLNAGSATPFDQLVGGLGAGTRYHWRARWQSKNLFFPFTPWFGPEQRSPTERHITTAGGPGPVAVDPLPSASSRVALAPASPNPSTGEATLAFTLPRGAEARLALYDLRGALVRTLFDGTARAGETRMRWDGLDTAGRVAPAGAYFARLTALGETRLEKVVRLP